MPTYNDNVKRRYIMGRDYFAALKPRRTLPGTQEYSRHIEEIFQ